MSAITFLGWRAVIKRMFGTLMYSGTWLLVLLLAVSSLPAAEESEESAAATNELSAEALRAHLQRQERANLLLQEKLQALQMSLEATREESDLAARRNADSLASRLKAVEQTLTSQREREMEVMQKSNRFLLTVAGIFGSVGLCAMVFTAWFLLRAMNRLAEVAAAFPPSLSSRPTLGLEDPTRPLTVLPPESNRLLGAIDKLEKRIYQLEHSPASISHGEPHTNPESNGLGLELIESGAESSANGPERFPVVVAKGESLLNLDQPDKALACFNEALAVKPGDPEVLVKKGSALERLKRWEEALRCYDQAIATDSSLTLAYLYKGGVFNQLERFSEALECYEQALRTQQKQPA